VAGATASSFQSTAVAAPTRRAVCAQVQDMLSQRADLPDGHPDRATLRTRSIVAGLPLARRLAAAWRGRGEPLDDLHRVAALALMKAVDGYNPSRQVAFVSYAVPTIVGALKRHFRDSTWRVRVPPGIKSLAVSIAPTSARLTQELGRPPTLQELADSVDATEEDVVVALNSWLAHHPDSLDALSTVGGGERLSPIDRVGEVDANVDKVNDLHDLGRLLAALTVRQQRILAMRFFDNMSQAQIATQIGVSQMHVSRLLVLTLARLRAGMPSEPSGSSTAVQ
jgi:RNA polymerase sigma-B factor